jgi:hypothetical protein
LVLASRKAGPSLRLPHRLLQRGSKRFAWMTHSLKLMLQTAAKALPLQNVLMQLFLEYQVDSAT